jgi:hypothetical protein
MGSLSTPTKFKIKQGMIDHDITFFYFFFVILGHKNWSWTTFVHFFVISIDNHEAKQRPFLGYDPYRTSYGGSNGFN